MEELQVETLAQSWINIHPNRVCVSIGDHPTPDDYISAFDAAMDQLVETATHSELDKFPELAIALSFSSAEQGLDTSYRRVMKKYTRSVVFLDLGIWLLLARDNNTLENIHPENVNSFLIRLNEYIANKIHNQH